MRALATRCLYRYRLTIGTARFGARPWDRLRIAVFMVMMPILRRLGWSWPMRHRLCLGDDVIEWWAENDADLGIIEEVFGRCVYDLTDIPVPNVIVDLGAHVGASVLFFAMKFPAARIVAVEPDPTNFAKLQRNVGSMSQVTLRNVAVGAQEGTITLYSAGRLDSWKSSTRAATRWHEPLRVRAMSLDDVVTESGIENVDMLKIDIEGAEYEVLESFAGLNSVRTIVGEVHPELMTSSVRDFTRLLREFRCDLPPVLMRDTTFRADRILSSGAWSVPTPAHRGVTG